MTKQLTTQEQLPAEIIQKLVLDGDIGKMQHQQKVDYYNRFCQSLGLNPLTQPFQIIKFQGKEKLYATKDCTEQLRKIHSVSIIELSTQHIGNVFVVTAKAQDKTGKTDASTGAVTITYPDVIVYYENNNKKTKPHPKAGKMMDGDELANALMKAETKAKRRVTLSICGLGMLNESELETMPKHKAVNIDPTSTAPFNWDAEQIEQPAIEEKKHLQKWADETTVTKEWDNAVTKLQDGKITLQQIAGHYILDAEQYLELQEISEKVNVEIPAP